MSHQQPGWSQARLGLRFRFTVAGLLDVSFLGHAFLLASPVVGVVPNLEFRWVWSKGVIAPFPRLSVDCSPRGC